jgi:hypothetical protein
VALVVTVMVGRSTSEGVKVTRVAAAFAVAVAVAGSASGSLAVDSAPVPPCFRFPNVAVRSSEIQSVIATQNSLLVLITA